MNGGIAIVGAGYVGVPMAQAFAEAGHSVLLVDVDPDRVERVLLHAYEAQPADFTELLAVPGLGAKGLRALSLVAELTYGEPASVRDPASYSFAHGGKDGTPYQYASFWSPPESVRITRACEASAARSR